MRYPSAKQIAFADAVAERAGRIGRSRVDDVIESVESDGHVAARAGAEARTENLAGAEDQKRRREISNAMRENSGEKTPVRFRHLSKAGSEARSAMCLRDLSRRERARQTQRLRPSRELRQFQNAARADQTNQQRSAQSGPSTAPNVSMARSKPNARPCCSGATASERSVSREGPRLPRPIHPSARITKIAGQDCAKAYAKVERPVASVAENAGGLAPFGTIGNPAAGQFRKTGKTVRDAFDHAERKSGRAQAREKRGKNRGGSFVAPVGKQDWPSRCPARRA